ncbi:MAG: cytochrome P450, partial [Acidimicrobiales bacterium]
MYKALRDRDPVHHVERGDYWVLSRFAHGFRAARDTGTFSSAHGLTFEYDDRHKAGLDEIAPMVFLDPPDHTALRRLVARGFTPRQVAAIEPDVRLFVIERIERLRAGGAGDIVAELLKPLPSFVVAQYLGVPAEDRGRFDRWTHGIVAANALGDPMLAADTVAELSSYFMELIDRRCRHAGDDVVSELVQASDSPGVSALQILGFAFTMVTGGNDTTTGLLSVGLELLAAAPHQRGLLIKQPALVPSAVEELLRLTSPVQGLARTVTADVEFGPASAGLRGGTAPTSSYSRGNRGPTGPAIASTFDGIVISKGKKVMLLFASANRDEREFGPDAEQLDVTRRARQIVTFGSGPHHCLGAAAARLMGRVALEELLARCPRFTVDPAAGRFAAGHFVRWYESLPFVADAGA